MRVASWLPGTAGVMLLCLGCSGEAGPTVSAPISTPRLTDDTASRQALQRLLLLMRDRLLLMHDVARWKWNEKRPIEDKEREQAFLRDVVSHADQLQLNPTFVRTFFTAQIEASKLVQKADHERWKAEGRKPFADVPDLVKVQRPRIDTLNMDLLVALAEAKPYLKEEGAEKRLRALAEDGLVGEGITSTVRDVAIAPLQ